jgi:hypothetical protein
MLCWANKNGEPSKPVQKKRWEGLTPPNFRSPIILLYIRVINLYVKKDGAISNRGGLNPFHQKKKQTCSTNKKRWRYV